MEGIAVLLVLSSFAFLSSNIGNGQTALNVISFGAKGDGQTDNTLAFGKAWVALCGATGGTPLLQIPNGTFMLKPINFTGPCKSTIVHIQLTGNIIAPATSDAWGGGCPNSLITIYGVNGVTLDGSGSINGWGQDWWKKASTLSCTRPVLLTLRASSNVNVGGLTLQNSPRTHIFIAQSKGVTIFNIHITAPEDSPNTDGINMVVSTGINIFSSSIGTGDDCVALKSGCSSINITGVNCGPGHGISVGSLGLGTDPDNVEDVHVKNCTFTGTLYGARIKTIPGGTGYAKNITFEQITLNKARFPIIIDQFYCLSGCQPKPSLVKVSDVTYSGFTGTSPTDVAAIVFNCSTIGCADITMSNNDITSSEGGGSMTSAFCINAQGTQTTNTPHVSCLAGNN